MLQSWLSSALDVRHPNIYKLTRLAAIIPGSTAEVERSFSLMNRLNTDSRSHLTSENLTHLMRICHFKQKIDFDGVLKLWLKAEDTDIKGIYMVEKPPCSV